MSLSSIFCTMCFARVGSFGGCNMIPSYERCHLSATMTFSKLIISLSYFSLTLSSPTFLFSSVKKNLFFFLSFSALTVSSYLHIFSFILLFFLLYCFTSPSPFLFFFFTAIFNRVKGVQMLKK